VHWPWLVSWILTVALIVAVSWLAIARLVQLRRASTEHVRLGPEFYLHRDKVMELYESHGHALEQQVEIKVRTSAGDEGAAKWRLISWIRRRSVDEETVRRFIMTAKPTTVVRTVVEALESADDIIHVDLTSGSIDSNKALVRIIRRRGGPVSLSALTGTYVSVRGQFRHAAPGSLTFLAPYGTSGAGKIRVPCKAEVFPKEVPDGDFPAQCVGRVQNWNSQLGELLLEPLAIFR
jgi:hypothetical protein